ncbi:hypothetical protein EST38_g4640 [Candolleomyces aberdarensis]|uniref:Uncharacterized protein n=1 Tax=Candolleomyces aberdarensis TaxID=2316362 RepID=A0A4Q2DMM6_9AGAR|nr:hypothetical protein EST38_g4640 [Candolleomyces aberdarensis]
MSAIWSAHQLALKTRTPAKSVCFEFLYTDALKILQKWGSGCNLMGHGLNTDVDEMEKIFEEAVKANPGAPILAFTFVNVQVVQYADIVVSSLTKVFSGASIDYGSILNPQSRHYNALKTKFTSTYEDVYFDDKDAIYMEGNSRDFQKPYPTHQLQR